MIFVSGTPLTTARSSCCPAVLFGDQPSCS